MSDWQDRARKKMAAPSESDWKDRARSKAGTKTPEAQVTIPGTIGRQALQGATFGFGDEITDRLGSAIAASMGYGNYDDFLKEARASTQAELEADTKQNPGTALAANIAGSLATGKAIAAPFKALQGVKAVQKVAQGANAIAKSGKTGATAVKAAKVAGEVGSNAAAGAAYGAGTAKDGERMKGAKGGAIGGAAAGVAMKGAQKVVGRVLNPNLDPKVKTLLKENVRLTPGQIMGGLAKRLEDGSTSIPVLGDAIRGAQRRGIKDLNTASLNRAIEPLNRGAGNTLPAIPGQAAPAVRGKVALPQDAQYGHDALAFTRKALSDAYDDVLPQMQAHLDPVFKTAMSQLQTDARATPGVGKDFDSILQSALYSRVNPQTNRLTGESFKEAIQSLRQEAQGYGKDPRVDRQKIGNFLKQARTYLSEAGARSSPDQAKRLADVDEAYANFKRSQSAAGNSSSVDGVFSPAQLQVATRQGDHSLNKRAFSEGDALQQDLSNAAKGVMPSSVPDSGTPLRGVIATLGGLGATGAVSPTAALAGAAGIGASSLAYTPTGVKALEYALARRPQIAQKLGAKISGATVNPVTTGNLGDMFFNE